MEEKEELNNLRQKYILTFDEFIKKGEKPWKTPEELSTVTGTTITQVNTVIKTFDDFVKNSKGQINTKNIYLKNEKFTKRLMDILNGRIK